MKIPMPTLTTIAFDADDTLWHNERHFESTKREFATLLSRYHTAEWIDDRLFGTEMRNLKHFGYGIKSFTLSMIETAIELTEGRIGGREVARILEMGKEMVATPVELLDGAEQTVRSLGKDYRILLVTKGDLFDQESKLARSGLGELFDDVHIVTEKDSATYRRILAAAGLEPHEFMMVGNSLRSDILPVVELGSHAVHVPHDTTWAHEHVVDSEVDECTYLTASSITEVPALIAGL